LSLQLVVPKVVIALVVLASSTPLKELLIGKKLEQKLAWWDTGSDAGRLTVNSMPKVS
jgi:hypothetical protein